MAASTALTKAHRQTAAARKTLARRRAASREQGQMVTGLVVGAVASGGLSYWRANQVSKGKHLPMGELLGGSGEAEEYSPPALDPAVIYGAAITSVSALLPAGYGRSIVAGVGVGVLQNGIGATGEAAARRAILKRVNADNATRARSREQGAAQQQDQEKVAGVDWEDDEDYETESGAVEIE